MTTLVKWPAPESAKLAMLPRTDGDRPLAVHQNGVFCLSCHLWLHVGGSKTLVSLPHCERKRWVAIGESNLIKLVLTSSSLIQ